MSNMFYNSIMVNRLKLVLSQSTYAVPYDDELYFINLEDYIEEGSINITKKDIDSFYKKAQFNYDHTNFWKDGKYCIFYIDNLADKLIMNFILEEIYYGIDRDWYNNVTNWNESIENKECRETLKIAKKEYNKYIKLVKQKGE